MNANSSWTVSLNTLLVIIYTSDSKTGMSSANLSTETHTTAFEYFDASLKTLTENQPIP